MTTTTTAPPAETQAPADPNGGSASNLPAVTTPQAVTRPSVQYDPDDPVSLYMNTGIFEQLQRVANLMCSSGLVPAHLRGKEHLSDCFLVAAQAFRWRMDPFAAAQHTFVTSGKLGYEGKLIAAVINSSAKMERNLAYVYSGEKGTPGRTVTVLGWLRGENEPRTVEGSVAQWQTANEKWKTMQDQMLAYRGSREWSRRHMPEAVLGIQAEEEVQETVTLQPDRNGRYVAPKSLEALNDRLEAETAQEAVETAAATPSEPPAAPEPATDPAPAPLTPLGEALADATGGEPEADPRTPEGNPFLRQVEKARRERKGQGSITE